MLSRVILLAAIFAATILPSSAADFHPITGVTTSTSNDLWPVSNLIQGPGAGYSATEPHDQLGSGSSSRWVTEGPTDDYFTSHPKPTLVFDLGQNRALGEISLWGYATTNANGLREFSLRFATAAEGTANFGASISYSPNFAAVIDDSERQSLPFSQTVSARYVELTCDDNFFGAGPPGGDRVGLGEVAFEDSVPANDPAIGFPASLALDLDGSVQSITVTVSNLGVANTLTISGASFSGANAAAFSVVTVPGGIAPGGSGDVELSFNPTGLSGSVAADLLISSNDVETPIATVSMTGFLHDPKVQVAPSLAFGTIPSGAGMQSATLPVNNAGGGQNLNIASATISGPGAASFSVTSFPATLAPLTGGDIDLAFDPQSGDGSYGATLTIATNDAVSPSVTVALSALVGDVVPGSGVRINEFVASNGSFDDGDGNSSDWIEIFNAGPGAADLSGWYLTDDASDLTAWRFPNGITLADGEFLVVFASGQDTDDYIDAGGSMHTNFKLTSGGEYLGLVRPDGSTVVSEFAPAYPAQFSDIAYGTFESGGSTIDAIANSDTDVLIPEDGSLGITWTFPNFTPDANWVTDGTGTGFGYEGGTGYDQWIDVDVEDIMRGVHPTIYARIPFTVADASAVAAITFEVRYDDGYVAYLNGVEIASGNAPAPPVWNSPATANASEPLQLFTIDATEHRSALVNGDNVLAIHGLNRSSGSSDFVIDPSLKLTLSGSGPVSIGYLNTATPGAPNTGGSSNPGPEITAVTHTPEQPSTSQSLTVSATIVPRLAAVAGATLHYRIGYAAEQSIAMTDLGGGSFNTVIPSSAYGPEDMVRWRVTADDTDGNSSKLPPFLDQTGNNQSPEYFGTVVADPSVTSDLPLFQWFTTNTSAAHSRSGARVSVYFAGRFYDNLFARQRGGATNGSISQKFDFNKGDPFYANDDMPSVGEININGNGADSTYVRQPLSFDTHRQAGVASCISELWQLRDNGTNDRVGVFIEQVDDDFLDRNGYDRDGDLYKMVQRSNLDPVFNDIITGIEKKTNDKADLSTLGDLVDGLNLPTSQARRRYIIDELDLPQICNYLAARSIIQDADDLRKNFYVYRDIHGDDRWRMFPWDKDFTFGVLGDGGTHLPHPFFGDEEHKKQNANQWNVLYDVVFEETTSQRLYLRRLRTLMDTVLENSSTPPASRFLENLADAIIGPASPPLSGNISSVDGYLNSRRNVLENNYPSLIPASQPANPNIVITDAEYNPPNDQDDEYIVLTNNENTEIDISGWCLTGGVEFTFAPGTVIERNSVLYVSPDTLAFRNRPTSPTGGEERLAVGPYSGHLSNFGETITLQDASKATVGSYTTPVDPSDAQQYLVISEIMYHPVSADAEFIELQNISDTITLDLGGVAFTAGIDYTFPAGTTLAPGARIVIDFAQFENASRLNNGSDRLKLEDASGSTIADFSYNDDAPWPTAADGDGPSLVLIDPSSNPDPSDPLNWRESASFGGNPGASDAIPYTGGDLVDYAIASGPDIALDTVSFDLFVGADAATVTPQWSTDLDTWSSEGLTELGQAPDGTASITVLYQLPPGERIFVRLHVEER